MCDRAQVLQPGRELCLSLEEVDGYTCFLFFFFFSSRRRHTRYWRDWSSDVCSSDLAALPDMRLPIAYGLLYPERVDVGVEPVPFGGASWTFEELRNELFRCLPLAVEAGRAGGAYPVALNAANEVAVEAFLERRIGFLHIAEVIEEVLEAVPDRSEERRVGKECRSRWSPYP